MSASNGLESHVDDLRTRGWCVIPDIISEPAGDIATVQDFGTTASRWALIVAIAAIGLRTSLDSLRTVGWQALALVVIETLALCGFVLIVVALFF